MHLHKWLTRRALKFDSLSLNILLIALIALRQISCKLLTKKINFFSLIIGYWFKAI
jgi:hypothetical protein